MTQKDQKITVFTKGALKRDYAYDSSIPLSISVKAKIKDGMAKGIFRKDLWRTFLPNGLNLNDIPGIPREL